MMARFFSIVLLVISTNTTFGQPIQSDGLVNLSSSFDPEGYRRYTWFKDSTVIIERMEQFSESWNDSIFSEGVRVAYYTILDLPSRHAQDYFLFSDKSEPFTNYYLKENETISWNFYANQLPYDCVVDSLAPDSDTLIDGNLNKRFSHIFSVDNCQAKFTLGLTCSKPKTIFHLNQALDEKYPDCQVTFFHIENLTQGYNIYSKLSMIRDRLTIPEKKIFEKWKSNLQTTELPVTSQKAATQLIATLRNISRSSPAKDKKQQIMQSHN